MEKVDPYNSNNIEYSSSIASIGIEYVSNYLSKMNYSGSVYNWEIDKIDPYNANDINYSGWNNYL